MIETIYEQKATPFKAIDLTTAKKVPRGCTRAFANNRYIVTIHDNHPTTKGDVSLAMIQNVNGTRLKNHWSEMQSIKNEIFGREAIGIEYYPKESELVNKHNIYWMLICPEEMLPILMEVE